MDIHVPKYIIFEHELITLNLRFKDIFEYFIKLGNGTFLIKKSILCCQNVLSDKQAVIL